MIHKTYMLLSLIDVSPVPTCTFVTCFVVLDKSEVQNKPYSNIPINMYVMSILMAVK